MSYAQTKIDAYTNSVDDEFELNQLHKSNIVNVTYSTWASYVVAAILAWALPGMLSYFALLALLPPVFGAMIGQNWLARNNPRARYLKLSAVEWAFTFLTLAICMAGLVFNAFSNSVPGAVGVVVGGVLGSVGAAYFAPKAQAKARRMDRERLDAELEEDA